eukprot:s2201_g1.t1
MAGPKHEAGDLQEALLMTVLPCLEVNTNLLPMSFQKLHQRRTKDLPREAREALSLWFYPRLLGGGACVTSRTSTAEGDLCASPGIQDGCGEDGQMAISRDFTKKKPLENWG